MNRILTGAFFSSVLFSTCVILGMAKCAYKEPGNSFQSAPMMPLCPVYTPKDPLKRYRVVLDGFEAQRENKFQENINLAQKLLSETADCLDYSKERLKNLFKALEELHFDLTNYVKCWRGNQINSARIITVAQEFQKYYAKRDEIGALTDLIKKTQNNIEQELKKRQLAAATGCEAGFTFTQGSSDLKKVQENILFFQKKIASMASEDQEKFYELKKELSKLNGDELNHEALIKLDKTIVAEDLMLFHYLLQFVTQIDIPIRDQKTALHIAAEVGNFHMILALVQKKANIHALDSAGNIPLDYAYNPWYGKDNFEAFAMLLYLHNQDKSAVEYKYEIVDILKHALSFRPNYEALIVNYGLTARKCCQRKACGDDINSRDGQYETALHQAVRRHDKVAVKRLLMNGADPTLKNKQGLNAVQLAAELPALYDIVPLFVDAALPARIVNKRFDDTLKHISLSIENHLSKIQAFKRETWNVLVSSQGIGLRAGAIIECCLGGYTLFKITQSARKFGFSQAIGQNWGKMILSLFSGCLGYVGVTLLTNSILEKKKGLPSMLKKITDERSSINCRVTYMKESLDPLPTDSHDQLDQKCRIYDLLKIMKASAP